MKKINVTFADDINMLAEYERIPSSLNHLEEVMLENKIRRKLMKYVKTDNRRMTIKLHTSQNRRI